MTTDTTAPHQFPVLDTLRAVGAVAVVATHCAFNAGAYSEWGAVGRLLARMDVGVALFFVLSGFLLARPWLAAAATGARRPGVRRYLWKRLLRIYPAYLVTAVLALVLIGDNHGRGIGAWVVTLVMGDIYVSDLLPYGLTQTWSLATEVAFYLVLPALMVLALGHGRRLRVGRVATVLAAMVVLNLVWLLDLSARVPVRTGHVNEWLPAYLSWFAIGIGLAVVQVAPERSRRVASALRLVAASPGSCWTIALGLLLLAGTSVAGPTALVPATAGEAVAKNLLYGAIAALVVLPGVFAPSASTYVRLMSHAVPRRLGQISYGIFLLHMSILQGVMALTGFPLFGGHLLPILALTLVLSIAAAEVLYRLVELPVMRLKDVGRSATSTPQAAARLSSTR